jgi:antitoxin HigA-1
MPYPVTGKGNGLSRSMVLGDCVSGLSTMIFMIWNWCNIIEGGEMLPRNRRPTPPGEILRHEFLEPLGLSQKELATALSITRVRLSEILRGKRSITPDTAFRLARFFDTTPEFWLGLQTDLSLWDTLQIHLKEYEKIKPLTTAE